MSVLVTVPLRIFLCFFDFRGFVIGLNSDGKIQPRTEKLIFPTCNEIYHLNKGASQLASIRVSPLYELLYKTISLLSPGVWYNSHY